MTKFNRSTGPVRRSVVGVTVITGALVAALGACGVTDGNSQPAAMRISAKASPATHTDQTRSGRPQLRLDSSDTEVNRLWHAYDLCLKAHGHKMYVHRGDGSSPDQRDHSPTAQRAERACRNLMPLQPPELDPKTNPNYRADYTVYLRCLKTNKVYVHPIKPYGTGWTYDSRTQPLSEAQRNTIDKRCQIQAFSTARR